MEYNGDQVTIENIATFDSPTSIFKLLGHKVFYISRQARSITLVEHDLKERKAVKHSQFQIEIEFDKVEFLVDWTHCLGWNQDNFGERAVIVVQKG